MKMALFLCVLFLFISYTSACCVYQSQVTYTSNSSAISAGACGYGSLVGSYYGSHLAASIPSIYKDGAGCGSCFQIRCTDKKICTKQGTKVVVTDVKNDKKNDFVLSSRAFRSMANKGMDKAILKQGHVDVEYKRVNCDFKRNNFSIRVEESSKNSYLAVKFLYQGGKTEILVVEAATVGAFGLSMNWISFSKKHGAIWETSRATSGPLLFRVAVLGGYDAQWFETKTPVPADRKVGMVYDTGAQISSNAMDGCSPCDDGSWNK